MKLSEPLCFICKSLPVPIFKTPLSGKLKSPNVPVPLALMFPLAVMCEEKLAVVPTIPAWLNVAVPADKAILVEVSPSNAKVSAITEPMFTMFWSAKSAPKANSFPLALISPLAVMCDWNETPPSPSILILSLSPRVLKIIWLFASSLKSVMCNPELLPPPGS